MYACLKCATGHKALKVLRIDLSQIGEHVMIKQKYASSIILLAVLLGVLGVALNVQRVKAPYPIIFIRADGSIDPLPANITSLDNVTYTFTADINGSIVVQRSNIIIDGNGHTLDGFSGAILEGLNLTGVSNVTIRNVNVVGFGYGIYLQSSILNVILENNITFNEGNVYLGDSSDNTITGNTITEGAEAIQLWASYNNTISNNSMISNLRGVWLRSGSTGNTISGNNITANTNEGIYLYSSSGNSISENDITNNWRGIDLSASSNNTLSGNNVAGNVAGISVGGALVNSVYVGSMNNTILGNKIVKNTNGIDTVGVLFTTISRNHIAENSQYGITLDAASNNTISANNITNNNLGIFYDGLCDNNTAYHNNFIDNAKQIEVSFGDVDAWDDGVEGNYYSDYAGVDLNHDGIGDSPHVLDANNTDNYPLMGVFSSFNTSLGYYVNVISNSTVEDFEYFEFNSTIRMFVSNMTANQTHGFCRVCIPYTLMNVTNISVVIDDGLTAVLNWNDTIYDNGTHRWIYFTYEHSTHEIVIIPEFSTWASILFILIVLTFAITTYKRRLLKKQI